MFQLIFTVTVLVSVASANYCSYCGPDQHIACNNNGQFGMSCPANTVLVPLNGNLKSIILNKHNALRSEIAQGKVPGYQPAARMATLQWNNELAKFAELNVKRCIFEHDRCRNTAVFNFAGQNLAQRMQSNQYQDDKEAIEKMILSWFNEYEVGDMSYIDRFRSPIGEKIGHFTQMVRDEAYAVGCAFIKYKMNMWYTSYLACDYSLTNMLGYPIYESSSQPASKCKTGQNPQYPGLCSVKELFNNPKYYN